MPSIIFRDKEERIHTNIVSLVIDMHSLKTFYHSGCYIISATATTSMSTMF